MAPLSRPEPIVKKSSAYEGWSLAAPALLALLYPYFLKGFHSSQEAGLPFAAAAFLALAFCAPASGFFAVLRLGRIQTPNRAQHRSKLVALLAIAAPPMYTAAGVLLYIAGDPVTDTTVWLILWGVLCVYGPLGLPPQRGPTQTEPAATVVPPALRAVHGASALAIVLLFLAMHLSNHLAGLLSEAVHRHLMDIFRLVYRAHVVEPIIVLLFLFQVVSGLMLLRAHAARAADFFRSLQIASGAYLVFFILGHMNSVFIYARRVARIETDWDFATGAPAGMLHDAWNIRLLPHYYLGVLFVLAHLVLGARIVALAHGVRHATANMLARVGIVLSAMVALLLLLGMCGVHLGTGNGIV
jgi:hypothetical protein